MIDSPVPWVFAAKGNSRDTWNGFQDERNAIFEFVRQAKMEGIVLLSADRHRHCHHHRAVLDHGGNYS